MSFDEFNAPHPQSIAPDALAELYDAVIQDIAINSPPPAPPKPKPRGAYGLDCLQPEGYSILTPAWREWDGGDGHTKDQL